MKNRFQIDAIKLINRREHEERDEEIQALISSNLLNQISIFKGSVGVEMSVEHDEIERNERGGV